MLDICNICLFTDIELQTIEEPLTDFHDELCDYGVDGFARYCLKCAYMLRKFYNFKNRCKKANIVLKKWMKQSKYTKTHINKLQEEIPTSIDLSYDNNHAIYSYNAKTEGDYTENSIESLVTNNIHNIDISDEDLSNFKPGFVILDSTCPPYNKDAIFIKTTDLISEENDDTESSDKLCIDLDVLSNKAKLQTDNRKDKRVSISRLKNYNKLVDNINSTDVITDSLEIDTFTKKRIVEKEAKEKKVKKCKITEDIEATVKLEVDAEKDNGILDGLAIVGEELKIEQSNDDDDILNDNDDIHDNGQDIDEDAINNQVTKTCGLDIDFNVDKPLKEFLDSISSSKNTKTKKGVPKRRKTKDLDSNDSDDDDDIHDNGQDIDEDAINNHVIKTCGLDIDFNVEKLLNDALDSDSSDNEALQKKRTKVISSRKKTETKKKKEVSKKRKSKDLNSDDLEYSEDEPKQKKPRWKPLTKQNLEETKRDVQRRLGNGDVKDKEGNIIEVDVILNHLEKMHKLTYNKLKRYCAGKEPLSSEAIDFLGRTVKRYGNQYSSIFITKHLTTDEEIMEEFRKRETNENYVQCEHKCTRCFRYFRFPKMLTYHIAEYHDPSKPYKCQYCDVSFNRPQALRRHLLAHKVVYQCKLCPLVTNYTTVMEAHFNIHKGIRYPCTKCGAEFNSPPALAAHMNCKHQADHICPCCARNFHSDWGLHQHKVQKHAIEINAVGPPSAKCEQCNIQFISDDVYFDHRWKSHNLSKKRKPCSNRKTPRYTCRVCNGVESSMGALIWHFKSEHPNEEFDRKGMALRDPYQYLCHECGKGFKMITSYTDHKNVHTGARPYTCTECPKAFHCRTHLRNHVAFHLPPTHQCAQCGKKFHRKSNLSNHLRNHADNRRYSCKDCGKMFKHQTTVNEHVRGVHLHIRRTRKPKK